MRKELNYFKFVVTNDEDKQAVNDRLPQISDQLEQSTKVKTLVQTILRLNGQI